MSKSTFTRGIGVGVGAGVTRGWPLAGGASVGAGLGDGVSGFGVTVIVASVGRSGGGFRKFPTFATSRPYR